MGWKKGYEVLISNLGHVHNMRRRFYASWDGAPSRLQGLAAYAVFFFQLITRKHEDNGYVDSNGSGSKLSEMFAHSVVHRT
jgi:hypothetical protein